VRVDRRHNDTRAEARWMTPTRFCVFWIETLGYLHASCLWICFESKKGL